MAELQNKYEIKFIGLSDSQSFTIGTNSNKEGLDNFIYSLLSAFPDEETINVRGRVVGLYRNTFSLQDKVRKSFEPFLKSLPQVNRILSYLKTKLKNEEYFCFLINPDYDTDPHQQEKIFLYLRSIQEGVDYLTLEENYKIQTYDIVENYIHYRFGKKQVKIGELNRNDRVCRFCKQSPPTTNFNNRAHAIPEALGNKTMISFDECDNCNSKFGKDSKDDRGIELDMIDFMSLFRAFYAIKGKGGIKEFEGKNFTIKNENKIFQISHKELHSDDFKNREFPPSVNLKLNTIVYQNIYRCLCKFFVSVIDSKYLSSFDRTVEWISEKFQAERLPLVRHVLTTKVLDQPEMSVFIRRKNNYNLPYAFGELHCMNAVFSFIIPFTNKDTQTFCEENSLDNLNTIFKFNTDNDKWVDFSNNLKRPFNINLNFNYVYEQK